MTETTDGRNMRTWPGIVSTALALSVMCLGTASLAKPIPPRQDMRAITPQDINGLTAVQDPQISPDGRHILYVVQPRLATATPDRSEIWITATDKRTPPRRLTEGTVRESSPRWSPDGSTIAYLSNRAIAGDGKAKPPAQIWVASPMGGTPRPLTANTEGIRSFLWSPDGKSIAFLALDPSDSENNTGGIGQEVDAPGRRIQLWIQHLATGEVRRIAVPGLTLTDISWSPDGTHIAARGAATSGLNDYFYHSRLLLLDAASGTVKRTLFENVYSGASWSLDGRRLTFTAPAADTIGTDAYIADILSGQVTKIGNGFGGTIRQVKWSNAPDTILARVALHTRQQIIRIDATTGSYKAQVPFDGQVTDFSVAKDGRIAIAANTPDRPADIWVQHGRSLSVITNMNPQIGYLALGTVKEVQWTSSRDGQPIYGVLILPPGKAPDRPLKTVVLTHGGPHESWISGWQGSWIDWAQVLAGRGYAVLLPNPRGSAGQGNAFARGVINGWGSNDYRDVTDGVDMLVKRGIADPARLGIGGWSYGGFLSAWAVTHDTRFRTAVIGAAPTDPLTLSLTSDTPDFVTAYFGIPPAATAHMDQSAPLRAINHVTVPVLILHGQNDVRVPLAQGLSFYRGLRLLDKPATMITYPGEPHRIADAQHQLDIQERILSWFDAHL